MEPSAFSCRVLAAYAPLRVTMQRKRPCGDLSMLYNGCLKNLVSQSPNRNRIKGGIKRMDILRMTYEAIEKQEMVNFLRGEKEYMVEVSQYAPIAELPDVGKILSRGIYKAYKVNMYIKNEFEQALYSMLEMSDYDVYIVCLYLASQIFKEKNELSPFTIDKHGYLFKIKGEIEKRKASLQNGIVYPNGYENENAWNELKRLKDVFKEEYNLILF